MKKVILSEDQIKRMIDKLVINEQNVVVGQKTNTVTSKENKVFPTTPLGDKFDFGQYDSPNVRSAIESLKPQISEFIKNSDSREFTVNIVAGESQVTNPKGFETKGSLALARANSVKKYFQEIFPDLIKNNTLKIVSPSDASQVKIGGTPYGGPKSGDNKNPEKIKLYKNEQFVNFNIVGAGSKTTTKTTTTNLVCDFQTEATGGFAKLENDFLYNIGKNKFPVGNLPDGSKIRIIFDTLKVPDLMVVQMGDYSYNTGFVGSRSDGMSNDLATLLGNAYIMKGKDIPTIFPQNIVQMLPEESKEYLNNLGEDIYIGTFSHIFPNGLPKKRKLPTFKFTEDPIRAYGTKDVKLSRELLQGNHGTVLDVIKKPGDETLTISIYSPIGSTAWNLKTKCI
jgi:hypothetical protein